MEEEKLRWSAARGSRTLATLYLALGHLYVPIEAAIPSYLNLRTHVVARQLQKLIRDCHPTWLNFPDHYHSVGMRTMRRYTTTQ